MKKNYLLTIMATAIVGAVIAKGSMLFATSPTTGGQASMELEDSLGNNTQLVKPDYPTPEFAELVADGETIYYLYNVDAHGFLAGSNEWNTRASVLKERGNAMRFEETEEGTYRLYDLVSDSPIMDDGAWSALDCDGDLNSWIDGEGRFGDGQWILNLYSDMTFTISNTVTYEIEENDGLLWGVDVLLEDTRCRFNYSDEGYGNRWAVVSEDAYEKYLEEVEGYENFGRIIYAEMPSWTSENHADGSVSSNEWVLDVRSNSTLSFDWSVSSESGCDWLSVYLNDQEILNESGEKSGKITMPLSGLNTQINSTDFESAVDWVNFHSPLTDWIEVAAPEQNIGKSGSKGVSVLSPAGAPNNWDTELFLTFDEPLAAGTPITVSFDCKATKPELVNTLAHGLPGEYLHYNCIGEIPFETTWKTFTYSGIVATDGMQTISMQLAIDKGDDVTYYIDNVRLSSGGAVLRAVYSKDGSVTHGTDEAKISQIKLYTDIAGILDDIAILESKLADYEGYDALQEELAAGIVDLQNTSDPNELLVKSYTLNGLFTLADEVKTSWNELNDNAKKYVEIASLTQDSSLMAAIETVDAVLADKALYTTASLQDIQSAEESLLEAVASLGIADGQKVWDFALSAQTIADLQYDYNNWGWWNNNTSYYYLGSSWSDYQQLRVHSSQGEKFIPETEGLLFNQGGYRWSWYVDGRLYISSTGSNYGFEIPNLKKGQKVSIDYATASSGYSRGIILNSSNATLESGNNVTTSQDVVTYEVTADGDVFFYPTGGAIYINSISVTVPNSLWSLVDSRKDVAEYLNSLDAFPGLQAELHEAYDKAVPTEGKTVDEICDELNAVLGNVSKAVQVYPHILADMEEADSVLTEGAYVDIAEAVELAQSIDVDVTTSETYLEAYETLQTALAIYKADQVERSDWAFSTSVVTIDGLRYYLDYTHHLAEFVGFNTNSTLTSLNIPATLNYNGSTYCVVAVANINRNTQSNIASVSLPKSLRYLADYAFAYYNKLTYINIPENVEAMGSNIFYYSDNLRAIKVNSVIPPAVGSFSGTSYKKITIPAESFHAYRMANVWKDYVLIGGDGVAVSTGKISAGDLGHIVLDEAGYIQEVNKLTIDEGTLNNDDWNTIKSMTNLIELDLSGVSASSIPNSLLDNRWAIEKVVLPHNVASIGQYAFHGTGIREIALPETTTTIGQYAFYNCDSLVTVDIQGAVATIPYYCFRDCERLSNVTLPSTVKTIDSYAFYNCDNLRQIELPASLNAINSYAFCDCNNLSQVNLHDYISSIGTYAFRYCPIKDLHISTRLSTISSYAFANNYAVDSLFIPANVKVIDNNAFDNNAVLSHVEFSEGLEELYSRAFLNCDGLTEVILPSTLQKCHNAPFSECDNIKHFEARSVLPPSTSNYCPISNANINDVVLYVPSWSTSEYQLADGWSSFYTVTTTDYMPQNILVNKDFYFTLRDTLSADYRPNIKMTFSDVQSTDAYGYTNYERGNLTISGRSKLAVNDFALEYSAFAKYYADENLYYGYDYDNYRTSVNSTSLIVNGEMRAEDVTIWLNTYNSRWQFISFPFDVNVADITPGSAGTSWVIRKHNGKARAAGNVNAVWENMNTVKVESQLAQPKFSAVATDGNTVQYLYNVETGTFVIGANEWSTRASVSPDGGYQFKVQANGDGTFTLNDYVENQGAWSAVFAENGESIWVDNTRGANVNGWVITENGDSTYTITNPGAREGHKLGVSTNLGDNRLYLDSDSNNGTTWAFVNANDYMAYLNSLQGEIVVDTLRAGQGYIMHTYNPTTTNSWFAVSPIKNTVNRQLIFSSEDRTIELEENLAEFDHNRSWNLIGNPYPSFYDTRFMDFDAPFMVWNSYSQNYVAYNPADDAYILSPGEAFFVQRPYDQESITFLKEGRQTHRYAREMDLNVRAQRVRSAANRQICNIVLQKDSLMDRTRVVLNEKASMGYELNRDVTKFASTEKSVPQIFTMSGNTRFAINERPAENGEVSLGIYCGTNGTYTISLAGEFAGKVMLEDKEQKVFCEISAENGYVFEAKAGECTGRFVLHFQNDATGIDGIMAGENDTDAIYNLQGMKVNAANNKGVYIKNGQKTIIK